MNPISSKNSRIAQADLIRPELVIRCFRECIQSTDHITRCNAEPGTVSRIGHNTHDTILRQRAAGPTLRRVPRPPIVRLIMKDVILIQQRDEEIDIEQGAQKLNAFLVH